MSGKSSEESTALQQWVVSIAITVVCCALFCLFFAGYFLRTQEKLIELQVRSEMQDARMNMLENNVLMLGQRVAAPAPPVPALVAPAPAVVAPPVVQSAPTPQAPDSVTTLPPVAKTSPGAAPQTFEPMGGGALLLNTESITPVYPQTPKKPQDKQDKKASPKPKTKSEAEE